MRKYVKVITFTVALALVLSALAVVNGIRVNRYRRELDNNCQRAVNGLAESVCQIDIWLHKCICAGSSEGLAESAAQVWAGSQMGKIHIGALPAADGQLDRIERFLAQAGECAVSAANEGNINEERYDQLAALCEYAGELRIALEDVIGEVSEPESFRERWHELLNITSGIPTKTEKRTSAYNLFSADEALADYPDMVYDGRYSNHVLQREAALLEGREEISAEQAREIAEKVVPDTLRLSGESEGKLSEYIFVSPDGTAEIAVTKQGGEISYMLRNVDIREQIIGTEEARSAAQTFLHSIGLKDFVCVEYSTYGGMCACSFAARQDNIVLYPDIVRVSVALDCGDVVAYDAHDYIMNHRKRDNLSAGKTCMQAQSVVSDMLSVTDSRLVLMQSEGLKEYLCYEFICRRWDGGEAVIFVNADTLREEKVLLLSRTVDSVSVV